MERRRRRWHEAGEQGLASRGSPGRPELSDTQFALLEQELAKGPAVHGWADQRWTLSRVQTVIGRRFHLTCSVAAVWRLLHPTVGPGRPPPDAPWNATRRQSNCGRRWGCPRLRGSVATGGNFAAALDAWIVFEDEAGFSMTPPRANTWGPRGQTPVVRVRGRSWRRWSIAALCCYKSGKRSRLTYQPRPYRRRKNERKSFDDWTDYRDLVRRAHLQLGGPVILIWDSLNTHLTAGMREHIAEHDWLTVFQLPPYAPDLNPVEGIWSLLRRGPLANVAFADNEHLVRTLRRGLRQIQYRPHLINGCLTETGLTTSNKHPTTRRKPQ
ncbi:IS630 family transposase [Streptomyces sp. 769]|uniref:IS630 family transposase n=1 Tax=Streptomyces sp. 769 TaxID=1262452 RepID=UPI000581E5F4|nr:IS630 family transposase [Streptomyces sp. 769]AJC53571.1 putative transposase [Streptomyces sp. 769]